MSMPERQSRAPLELRAFIDCVSALAWTALPDGSVEYFNQKFTDYSGWSLQQIPRASMLRGGLHRDDLGRFEEWWQRIRESRKPTPTEARFRRADGEYRWFQISAAPVYDVQGNLVRWCGINIDIEDRKRAEEKLQQTEEDLRRILDAIPQAVLVLSADGTTLYANRVTLEISGHTMDDIKNNTYFQVATFHPDDEARFRIERQEGFSRGIQFGLEVRTLHQNGEYRWFLNQYNPLRDEYGHVSRWYVTGTDIDDQKKTEERLRDQNERFDQERLYLEDQIRSEMGFEQIIGNSRALKQVLQLVETVAPSDSTVLLLGETGTGKELIARAIHERSRRRAKTFVKLNCAAIPTGLLESELFGHEKGAFTGAIIQKVGRMEVADQGTLFLDEVGDIPVDIQPKLLRALQEREFERLGSTHTRKVNVRLVAASNRDLEEMVADREFRSDLFYRLNVFPIRIPPLRERKEDIPLLVAYFVEKFAKQMQKRIDSIPGATMKALTAWDWPGNIRELENFIERAVILTQGESLVAPLSELRTIKEGAGRESAPKPEEDITRIVEQTIASLQKSKRASNERMKRQHDEIIRVLTECKGRVGGAHGAAVRMGLSRTTLISRMKRLGIDPYDH
jgi:formate hydrogenlyase transcriptional activator